ncbi:MAG: hypothetical protein H7A23_03780 [Leptospiraceae bacterium]|nr:hypothetical protein [Leptospiraceae bacterium]MCP5493651.1 hypothetical protein [Leptospiraceae bacterium]
MKKLIPYILCLFLLFSFSGCLTNILNCPEDTLKTSSCPTQEQKDEDRQLFLILLILVAR